MAVMSVSLPSVPFSSNQKYATTCFEIALSPHQGAEGIHCGAETDWRALSPRLHRWTSRSYDARHSLSRLRCSIRPNMLSSPDRPHETQVSPTRNSTERFFDRSSAVEEVVELVDYHLNRGLKKAIVLEPVLCTSPNNRKNAVRRLR